MSGPAESIDQTISRAAEEGAAEPTPVVFIVGAGVVGTALAAKLVRAGVPVAGLHGRQPELSDAASALAGVLATTGDLPAIISESDVVIISVRDQRIPEVAERLVRERHLRPHQVVLHTSGAHAAADVLAPVRAQVKAVGTLHPLVSFADPKVAAESIGAVAFGIEGDEPARIVARRLVRALGARSITIDARGMPLYHAGAVLASNYVVALVDIARSLLVRAGVPEDQAVPALAPLLASVAQNVAELGVPAALTGPVERGDASTVERHVTALQAQAPDALELYQLLGREALRLAQGKSALPADAVERMTALFEGSEKSAAQGGKGERRRRTTLKRG